MVIDDLEHQMHTKLYARLLSGTLDLSKLKLYNCGEELVQVSRVCRHPNAHAQALRHAPGVGSLSAPLFNAGGQTGCGHPCLYPVPNEIGSKHLEIY